MPLNCGNVADIYLAVAVGVADMEGVGCDFCFIGAVVVRVDLQADRVLVDFVDENGIVVCGKAA